MECEYCGKYIVETDTALAEYTIHLLINHKVDPQKREYTDPRPRYYWANPPR